MLAIIIVNYNDWSNLQNCINSICVGFSYRIYVVDNASKKNLYINELKQNQNVVYIESEINGGYSYGNNVGLKRALEHGCNYFIISNTDIIYNNRSIESLISILKQNNFDIVGPKILLPSGKIQEEILGVRVNPFGKIKLIFNSASNNLFFKQYRRLFNNKDKRQEGYYEVYGLSGCCFAFNEKIAREILPFDEKIFLFNEEWYIAEKSYSKGFKTMITCDSIVVHLHGATTKHIKLFSYKEFVKSEFYVLNKLFPKFFLVNLLILLLRFPKLIFLFLKERISFT